MAIANADDAVLAHILEVTPGTTPATPVFQDLGFTSETLAVSPRTFEDDTISSTPDVQDLILTGRDVGGPIAINLRDGALEPMIESGLRNSFSTDVIVNASTDTAHTFEVRRPTGGTTMYKRVRGGYVTRVGLEMRLEQPIRASLNILGLSGEQSSTTITGATYTAAPTERVFEVVSDFSGFSMTGLTTPIVTALTLEFDNGPREQRQLGSADLAGVGHGKTRITGSVEVYLDENQLSAMQAAIDNTESDLTVTLGSVTGKKYTVEIPRLKFGSLADPIQGTNTDIIITLPFTGLSDTVTLSGETIRITRNVA